MRIVIDPAQVSFLLSSGFVGDADAMAAWCGGDSRAAACSTWSPAELTHYRRP
jgi:hypothetical protein